MPVYLTDDAEAEAARLAEIHSYLSPAEIAASPMMLIGTVDEAADQLIERRHGLGLSYSVLRGAEPEALAPVLERVRSSG